MLIILHNPWNAGTTAHVKTIISSGQALGEHRSTPRESTRQSRPVSSLPSSPSHSKRPQIYNQSLWNFVIRARFRCTAAKMMRRQTNSADAQTNASSFLGRLQRPETRALLQYLSPANVSLLSYVAVRPHWRCTNRARAQSRSWPCWCHMTNPHAALAYNPPTNHLQSYHKD